MTLLSKLVEVKLSDKDEELIHYVPDLIYLIVKALFLIDEKNGFKPFINESKERKQAFNLLLNLSHNNLNLSIQVITNLSNFFCKEEKDYNAYQIANLRQTGSFVGLRNLGNTCYINSLVQQLYHNTAFRNKILTNKSPNSVEGTYVVFKELQSLFAGLHLSNLEYITTKDFCNNFRMFDGQPINRNFQQDVNEFFNLLMDALENAIKETQKNNFITSYFTGTLQNKITSVEEEFPFEKSNQEPFINIALDIRNKISLVNALDAFIKGSMLDGDNKYHCIKYDKKIDCKQEYRFKQLRENLVFVLNRFEYDHINHQRKKLNDYFEFPFELNMERWMNEKDKKCVYELSGVIIHSGVAEAGHYYSYIKIKDKWYEFNDIRIKETIITPVR